MKSIIALILILIISCSLLAQNENIIQVTGKKYIGKTINGVSVREVQGNVILKQGNVVITCDTALQYISSNNAKLIGNVVITQDTVTIITNEGYYYGSERRAETTTGIKLNDKKVILTADSGNYYFNEKKAVFMHNVKLYDTTSTLTSERLIYFRDEDRVIATGNVKIINASNIIYADSLDYYRKNKISFAYRNVEIRDLKNNVMIFGNHLEHYANKHYTLVDKNPLLMQIDTTYSSTEGMTNGAGRFGLDTLVIRSRKMESFRDSVDTYKAEDSVRIVRGEFASRNDFTIYYRKQYKIVTEKLSDNFPQPILWYDNSQLTGDSVTIFLQDNKINHMEINDNAFVLSQDSIYHKRFNQLSGSKVIAYFNDDQLTKTEVFGGVHSIYYLFEDTTRNGLTKSSSEKATINFLNKRVNEVKLYGSPASDYYPEKMVRGNERAFTLPHYVFYTNKPTKQELLKGVKIHFE